MGNPIAHSLSPRIHGMFARRTGEDLSYEAILVPLNGLPEAVERFIRQDGCGLNITVPFKQEAWSLVDRRGGRAERAGAVNTIIVADDGSTLGENTDGTGLVRDLSENLDYSLQGRRILILGAGGAVRGVLQPILEEDPAELVIANRTVARAEGLREEFSGLGTIDACGFDRLTDKRFDLIINGTSAGVRGEVPSVPAEAVGPRTFCYDMFYAATPTTFLHWAHARGAGRAVDGLGMLVEQAAESFWLWRGVRPQTTPVIEALRA